MATHSSVLAWRIPGTGEPGGLPSMGSHRVGRDWSDAAAAAAVAFSVKYLSMHVYLRLSCDYIEIVHFGQEYHRSDIVCSLVHHIRVFMILNVLLTMVSVSITWLKCLLVFFSFFFGCNVTIFPYVINKYLFRGDTLWLCWYLVFLQVLSSGFCILWYSFSATIITVVLVNGDF